MKKLFLILGISILLSDFVFAVETNNQGKDLFLLFKNSIDLWLPKILQVASWLFWTFVTIDWVLTFGFMATKGTSINELLSELIKKTIVIGFFLIFFVYPNWLNTIPQSFSKLADIANGTSIIVTIDGIMEEAVNIFIAFAKGFSVTSLINSIALFFCALISAILLTYVGGRLFVVQLSLYIKIAVAPLIFSLGGLTQTRQLAINPIISIIKGGFELFLLKLFLGLSLTIFLQFSNEVQPNLQSAIMVVLVPILIAMLITNIPSIVESLLSGHLAGSSMNASGTMATAGLIGGAAGGAAGFATGAATGAVGAKQAIDAAKNLSAENGRSTFSNLREASKRDTINSMIGANKYTAGNKGARMASMMNWDAQSQKSNTDLSHNSTSNDFQGAIQKANHSTSEHNEVTPDYVSGTN